MSFYQKKFPHLNVEIKNNHELWLELNNPDQMNAITYEMINSLTTVLEYADYDQEMRVVVLTGNGKNFCAGGDIKAMEEKSGMFSGEPNELRSHYEHGIQRIPRTMEKISVPVIAMVNGAAVGAGCDLSMMCDFRVGNQKTKFAETFTRLGLVPGDGGTFFLQRVIGYSKAMQMFLTAKSYEGREALDYGLMSEFVESADLAELKNKTAELAGLISQGAPVAQRLTKKAMKASYLYDLENALNLLSSYQGISQRTEDHFLALKGFKEKTPPDFKGQ